MAMRYPGGLIATSPVNAAYPSGVWTQSQTIPYASQNVWQQDQYWRNTTLLLHGDGTNGAQNNTFLDSGTANSGSGFTITRNGNTTQGAFTPFQQNGYWSNYLGGAGNYFQTPANSATTIVGTLSSTVNLTIECWIFPTAYNSSANFPGLIGDMIATAENNNWSWGITNTGTLMLYWNISGTQYRATSAAAVSLNTWTHIALNVSAGAITMYINGVSQTLSGTTTLGTPSGSNNYLVIGQWNNGSGGTGGTSNGLYTGYISNLRVVKASTYTSSFTPSTVPLTAITSTSLLYCQSNRFVDNSSNAFAITVNGTPSVQAFQPFPGPTTWSASVLGGSGYFDGSGDSLQTPSNAAFTFGTGDFTLECWAYLSGNYPGVVSGIVDISTSNSTGRLVLDLYSTGYVNIETVGVSLVASNTLLPKNAWSHLVAVRSGTTLSLFQNGTRVGTATNSTNFSFSQAYVGVTSDGYYWSGYLSSVRLVKGTAVYDPSQSTLTVPTSPLTNISNTSLLLNMTNAGIFDNAQMNDLETVGNAQVSTSVVKYGTGSMAFDGSGDYLVGRTTDLLSFNTGDFTVEMWVYPNSVAGNIVLIDTRSSGTDSGWAFYINSSSKLALFTSNADRITAGSALSASTWTHVVLARSGSTLAIYMNGVQSATATYSTTMTCPGRISIASGFDNAAPLNGYIDDLRITKGVARYTANFTPPIARMPNQ